MIKVGDLIKRNDTLAIYPEDVCPLNMDFDQVYNVLAIHTRHIKDMLESASFQVAQISIGEVNIDLIRKCE